MAADLLYRLVWTTPRGTTVARPPASRDEALAEFDRCRAIRLEACAGQGRLRVMRDSDFRRST